MSFFSLEQNRFAYGADFACYGSTVLALAAWLPLAGPRGQWLAMSACTFAGLVGWTAIEYLLHRFVLHGVQPFSGWHAEHHRRPRARIGTPTIFSAALIATLIFLPGALLADVWLAGAMTLGVLAGYFAYAVTHHAIHHWPADGAWLGRRQRWHLRHHRRPRANYGVTTALWDHVFRSAIAPCER